MTLHRIVIVACMMSIGGASLCRAQVSAERVDTEVIARIKEEGLQRSQVMEIASYLTDVHGPRLTGAPATRRAGEWTGAKLREWGLQDVQLEAWGPFGRGWSLEGFAANLVSPEFAPLIAIPKAWSPSTPQAVRGEPIFLDVSTEADLAKYRGKLHRAIVLLGQPRTVKALFDPPARRHTDESLLDLANADGSANRGPRSSAPRGSSGDRSGQGAVGDPPAGAETTPAAPPSSSPPAAAANPAPPAAQPAAAEPSAPQPDKPAPRQAADPRGTAQLQNDLWQMIYEEGAALVLEPAQGDGGTIFVAAARMPRQREGEGRGGDGPGNNSNRGPRPWALDAPEIVPQVVVAVEQYNRLVRMLQRGAHPQVQVDIASRYHNDDPQSFNIIAEIPGSDLKHEVVMLGAHFDSWHSGTGATDNAIGCSVAMEAVRILQAIDAKPRRTVRLALWTGEEQGLLGSRAYVNKHFGRAVPAERRDRERSPADRPSGEAAAAGTDTKGNTTAASPAANAAAEVPDGAPASSGAGITAANQPESSPPASRGRPRMKYELQQGHEHLSAYFNLDNGGGKIRGIYLQGNESLRPVFRAWLKPFAELGAATISAAGTGGTGHTTFDAVGLPGFQFIQDPLEYNSRTHHSNMDVYDRLQSDDARQAAVIMASFVYLAANRDAKLTRKPLEGEVVVAGSSE